MGFKSKHDDVADTISMLSEIDAFMPNVDTTIDLREENPDRQVWSNLYSKEDTEDFAGKSNIF